MQYKTVSVEHYFYQNRKKSFSLDKKYEELINQEAMNGWKFVGVHTLPIERRRGCKWWFLFMFWERLQVDVLVFYKDDGTDAYTGPVYQSEQKKSGEAMKKAGAAVVGATKNAVNFMKSEETANKLSSLKNKAMSSVSGLMNNSGSDDGSDNPHE